MSKKPKMVFPVTCNDTGEICRNYGEYLKSEHWQNFRIKFYNSDYFLKQGKFPGACSCCGNKESLDLHHTTYRRLGREKLKDIVAVCRKCHTNIHEIVFEKHSWKKIRSKKLKNLDVCAKIPESKKTCKDKRRESRLRKRAKKKEIEDQTNKIKNKDKRWGKFDFEKELRKYKNSPKQEKRQIWTGDKFVYI